MEAGAHGHSHGHPAVDLAIAAANVTKHYDPAYFTHSENSGLLTAHILIMIVAWVFILPIGVMLSLSRSRYSLIVRLGFLVSNAIGLLFGTIYNSGTPDLYENNLHHKFGWVLTCIVSIHALLSFLPAYAPKKVAESPSLPEVDYRRLRDAQSAEYYRYSRDSGQGTEPASPSTSYPGTPQRTASDLSDRFVHRGVDFGDSDEEKHGLLGSNVVDRYFARQIAVLTSGKLGQYAGIICEVVDRAVLILGFVAMSSGFVTYFGYFKGHGIFSGLAHFAKGGIFFWYGLLVLGRCMGSFADLGWSWNVKPDASIVGQRKARAPSAEFVESFLIFFYGSTNIFLEHLGNWGKEWTVSDLEHISITIMFFGGGLCGMLIESKWIRDLLNRGLTTSGHCHGLGVSTDSWQPPKTYGFSLNPLPGIVIMLLGLMMSSHHQESMVSTMLHKQWGTLFVAAAMARAVTYILVYISPPTSYLPSRPPSELVVAFCLISGGLMFMGSAADIVESMERFNLNAMFSFTVMMGLTSFLMAWEIIVLALKGWSLRMGQDRTAVSA